MSASTLPALPPKPIVIGSIPPTLVRRAEPARRARIWEFNTNLHCSIIGTCLSTNELRHTLKKLGLVAPDSTDHELHGAAVSLAGRHDRAAKLLNKALDERHRLTINQFARVHTESEVRGMWHHAVKRGDIPGAYWAALTHPASTQAVIREAFGEVHMLSHLVGAANRADIRRLCQLEVENAALQDRLERQQIALRDAVVSRDTCIQELRQALAQRIASEPCTVADDGSVLRQVVADRERRLASEMRRSVALDERLNEAKAALVAERSARAVVERDRAALRRELQAIDASVLAACDGEAAPPKLDGTTLLYVGGRPHQVAHLRAVAERSGARFLHHDGGIEHHLNLLAGLTSQADVVVFPVDCISHHAAQVAKTQCQQADKRFVPLRSASVTSLLAALRQTG